MTIRENEEKKAILKQLRQLSEYYTPNWDPAKPGAASALAELFAELMAQNSAELSSIWERHHLMYLNMYGLKQNNASPASGYVCVMPTSENSVYIPSGTRLSSASDVEFVTTEELNASNAQISAVFYVADNYISKGNTEKLFDFSGENLQETALVFSANDITHGDGACEFSVSLLDISGTDQHGTTPYADIGSDDVRWQYLVQNGADDITDVTFENNMFVLRTQQPIPVTEFNGIKGSWIKAIFKNGNVMSRISPASVTVTAQADRIPPKAVYLNDTMLTANNFYPFGEGPVEFDSFYICSNDCLSKKGSTVTVTMNYSYVDTIEGKEEKVPVQWKNVIPVSKFETKPPLVKKIELAVWEYWNGKGWCRIYTDNENSKFFADESCASMSISFTCPDDLSPVFVGADEGLFIRCRIDKMTPGYSQNMTLRLPFVENVELSYSYNGSQHTADTVFLLKDLACIEAGSSGITVPKIHEKGTSYTYLCFDRPLSTGYTSIAFRLKRLALCRESEWQSLSAGNRWNELPFSDLTNGFRQNGIVKLYIEEPMQLTTLFGQKGYWLRIAMKTRPDTVLLDGIHLNAVQICQQKNMAEMGFIIASDDTKPELKLGSGSVYDAQVTVLNNGNWISLSNEQFSLDNGNGILRFDRGFVPPAADEPTVRVRYSVTTGAAGNLNAGEISYFLDPVPFVDTVTNPENTHGGRNTESFDQCYTRGTSKVSTLERCISEKDYEIAAKNADPSILDARCYFKHSTVTLVLLTDRRFDGEFTAAKLSVSNAILPAMPFHMRDKLNIIPAVYIEIQPVILCRTDEKVFPQAIENAIISRLKTFLDPISGDISGEGFRIGTYPTISQMYEIISDIPHVTSVDNIQLICKNGELTLDYEDAIKIKFGVPVCGMPIINIKEQ